MLIHTVTGLIYSSHSLLVLYKDESKATGSTDDSIVQIDVEHEGSALVQESAKSQEASEEAQRSWEVLLKQRVAAEVAESEATLRALEKGEAKHTIK